MSTTLPSLLDHILVLVFAVLWPLYERVHGYPRFKQRLADGRPGVRFREYVHAMLLQWTLAAVVVAAWLAQGRSLEALGLGMHPGPGLAVGVAIAAAIAVFLAMQARAIAARPEALGAVRQQLAAASPLLPRDRRERVGFRALSVTAGVCEETLFRGMLIAYLTSLAGLVPAVIVSSAVFGIAHGYLSARDAVKAGLAGLAMALLFVLTRSLWVPMLVHAMVDWSSGELAALAFRDEEAPRSAA